MTTEPRKSFGFLERAAAFDPKPRGPRFMKLPPPIALMPPDEERPTERPYNRRQRDEKPKTDDLMSTSIDTFLDRQKARELRRKARQQQVTGFLERRYAPFNPFEGENA